MTITMDRRDRRHQQTREEIVAAAEALVLAGDPESVTVHAVARAIGVTPGALYRYFPSRDAIVAAVEARVLADLAAAVDEAVAGAPPEPIARLIAASGGVLVFAKGSPHRYALLSRMLAVPRRILTDDDAAPVIAIAVGVLGRVQGLFAAAQACGALRPGEDASRVLALWAAIHGAVQLDKLARFAPAADATHIGREAVDALLLGWGADPASIGREPCGQGAT